jgi:hypothetical protein
LGSINLERQKFLFMEIPFKTVNPSQFKLRIVWGFETGCKLVAEFSDSSWLPSQGDVLILPVDEILRGRTWQQYKVSNVIYDFENQITRVTCATFTSLSSKYTKTYLGTTSMITQKIQEVEKKAEEILTNKSELSFETPKDLDEELEILKKQLLS